jgi:hypothetical protein
LSRGLKHEFGIDSILGKGRIFGQFSGIYVNPSRGIWIEFVYTANNLPDNRVFHSQMMLYPAFMPKCEKDCIL